MELWTKILNRISEKISKPSSTWLANTTAEIEDDLLIVKAQNELQAMWLEERYKTLILKLLEK